MLQYYPVEVVQFQTIVEFQVPAFSQEDAVERMKDVSAGRLNLMTVRAPTTGTG
jgi:hypothetical protein